MDTLRILVIDDCDDDAEVIRLTLRQAGIGAQCVRVDTLPQLATALDDEQGWDFVICDNVMPGLDAQRALLLVRLALPATPVVLMCGEYPHALWYEMATGLHFLAKTHFRELPSTLTRLLQSRCKSSISVTRLVELGT